ncbi:MAG: 2-isopropylmalate synthase [bacterium]|nr:2-isopropylmalate synthase [bacterium]
MAADHYRPFPRLALQDRRWPDRAIEHAPRWCSVDLRDGNQALVEPMGRERKMRVYQGLVDLGFKEIEVGFPAASETEYEFVREIIEQGLIPDDVTIQVLTQARQDLIDRTMEAIRGARRAIVHVYNSASTLQRKVVFRLDEPAIIDIAVRGVRRVKELAARMPETEVVLEYSPESFTGTEPEYAVAICEAVLDEWGATRDEPVIINLPSTVELSTPNVYADQIEFFCRALRQRERAIVSVHPHNDRGCGVAAAELALLAGAERIEGTLFGNGERTGNVCVVTLALNMMTQGVDPELDFSDIERVRQLAEECTRLPVHPRHPYAGDLVFTAFSGSHQDAIKKGLAAQQASDSEIWEVPYLPVDPKDVGRTYDAVIRINSQSGKGGVAYVMERDHGFRLPRGFQVEFSRDVQRVANETGNELSSQQISEIFEREYLHVTGPYELTDFSWNRDSTDSGGCHVSAMLQRGDERVELSGAGGGPVHAFVEALNDAFETDLEVRDYNEHSLGMGADAKAVAYVELAPVGAVASDSRCGVATDESIVAAPIRALIVAFNRLVKTGLDWTK